MHARPARPILAALGICGLALAGASAAAPPPAEGPPSSAAASAAASQPPLEVSFHDLRGLPIQANGRVKPFDTFCREQLYAVTGDVAPHDAPGEDPVFTVLQMVLEPDAFRARRVILVRNLELTRAFTGQATAKVYVSLADLEENHGWKEFQQGPAFRGALTKEKGFTPTEEAVRELLERAHLARGTAEQLRLLPVSDLPEKAWLPISRAHTAFPDGRFTPLQQTEHTLIEAFKRRDVPAFEQAEGELAATLRGYDFRVYPPDSVLDVELLYNQVRPFRAAYWLCFLAAALFLLHRTALRRPGVWTAAVTTLGLGLALHAGGIATRTFITQFAPVGSLYETAVWIGGVAVLLSFAFELWMRASSVGLAGALFGGAVLVLADRLPLLSEAAARHVDPAMNPLVPVLRSYWLNIHVTCMLTSYGSLGLACALGLDSFIVWLRNGGATQVAATLRDPDLTKAPRAAWAKHEPKLTPEVASRLERTELFNFRVIQVGFTLLTAGVLLGAVWANQSWGRYWGWDPKETWAFITWLIYAAYIHFRFMGWVKGPVSTMWNLLGFTCVVFTYLGVSFLLPGLHSYLEPS